MNAGARTVVLGAAVGYAEAQVAPFVSSLRSTGYRGDVILLAERELAARAATDARFAGVRWLVQRQWFPVRHGLFSGRPRLLTSWLWRVIQVGAWLALRLVGGLPPTRLRRRVQTWLGTRLFAPTESRFLRFLDFLEANDGYDRILVSDVRDVVFQDEPFASLPEQGLGISMEAARFTVGSEAFNAGWVRAAYGQRMLERIGHNPVSCSGVTYGDREAMRRYLQAMSDEILSLPLRAAGSSGVDQGVHNRLVWSGQLDGVFRMETLAGPVATLGGIDASELRLAADGRLLNRDGTIPCIVHQYDRHPALLAARSGAARLKPAAERGGP